MEESRKDGEVVPGQVGKRKVKRYKARTVKIVRPRFFTVVDAQGNPEFVVASGNCSVEEVLRVAKERHGREFCDVIKDEPLSVDVPPTD